MNNSKLYIIMRTDMDSLTPGKAMAQAAHAANDCETSIMKHGNKNIKKAWKEWKDDRGYGTTIVLNGKNEETIRDSMNLFSKQTLNTDYVMGHIVDPTYPIQDGEAMHFLPVYTCGWVFVEDTSKAETYHLGNLLKYYYSK